MPKLIKCGLILMITIIFVIQRLETGLHINRLYKRPRTYKTRDDCANPYVVKRENTLAKETLCITT